MKTEVIHTTRKEKSILLFFPLILNYSVRSIYSHTNSYNNPAFIGSIFVCGPLHHHVLLFNLNIVSVISNLSYQTLRFILVPGSPYDKRGKTRARNEDRDNCFRLRISLAQIFLHHDLRDNCLFVIP